MPFARNWGGSVAELILGESLSALIDHRGKTPKKLGGDFTKSGPQVISALLINGGRIKLEEARHVTREMWQKWMPVPTRSGDVILTSEAPLGRCARIPDDSEYVLGQRVFGLRGKEGVLDSAFLYYALQSEYVQGQLRSRSSGTTVTGIRQSELVKLRIPSPGFDDQKGVAAVLEVLDEKIDVNKLIAATAEDLSMTLVSGEPRRERVRLDEICVLRKDQVVPQELADDAVDHYSLPAFDAGKLPDRVSPESIKSGKFTVAESAVLLSKLNPDIPRVWNVDPDPEVPALASTEFLVLVPRGSLTAHELWAVTSQGRFLDDLTSKVTGTSKSHQRVRPAEVMATEVVDPRQFGETGQRIWNLASRAALARQESQALAALRDTLLPQLMSGRLRVKDAEKIVEDNT